MDEEKKVYTKKKKENDNWFLKAEKIRKIAPIALFIHKKIEEAKEKHKEPPALKEISPAWKKLSKNEKNHLRNTPKKSTKKRKSQEQQRNQDNPSVIKCGTIK